MPAFAAEKASDGNVIASIAHACMPLIKICKYRAEKRVWNLRVEINPDFGKKQCECDQAIITIKG